MAKKLSPSWSTATKVFFGLLLLLSGIGLFFVFEASAVESFKLFANPYHFFRQQALWLLVAFFALALSYFLQLQFLEKLALPIYLLALILLVLPLIPGVGLELNGAKRWIALPFSTLQPVEFFKFALVNFYASFLAKKAKLSTFVFFLFWPVLILLLQPDFGSLLVVVLTAFTLYFLANGSLKALSLTFLLTVLLALPLVLLSPYRRERIETFFRPTEGQQASSYHVRQVTLALGNGALFGQGIGNSQQKYAYVPEASSDSIFAIIAEEVGFVGSVVLISLFLFYFLSADRMFKHKVEESSNYQYLLFYGLLAWIVLQFLLNLAAVVVLLPLTGVPLPFFSQGGSALVMLFVANGCLLNLANRRKQ